MKYLLLMIDTREHLETHPEPFDPNPPEAWNDELRRRKADLGGERLRPPEEARTVRRRDGRTLAVDGPYAEVREQIAGYCLIEVADLDEAIDLASRHPAAQWGPIEIRALWDQ